MKKITVYCGSNNGVNPVFVKKADELGTLMAKRNISLIYGGAKIGIMGATANAVLKNNGKAIGIIPRFLTDKEVLHDNLTELIIVETMHERKIKLIEMADAFIILPGGIGTLDELREVLCFTQLGLIQKPVGLLNLDNYFNSLIDFFNNMVKERLMPKELADSVLISDNVNDLINLLTSFKPKKIAKWIDNV